MVVLVEAVKRVKGRRKQQTTWSVRNGERRTRAAHRKYKRAIVKIIRNIILQTISPCIEFFSSSFIEDVSRAVAKHLLLELGSRSILLTQSIHNHYPIHFNKFEALTQFHLKGELENVCWRQVGKATSPLRHSGLEWR